MEDEEYLSMQQRLKEPDTPLVSNVFPNSLLCSVSNM